MAQRYHSPSERVQPGQGMWERPTSADEGASTGGGGRAWRWTARLSGFPGAGSGASSGQLGLYTTAAGYGLEAFTQLTQSINAGKRARALADYNARVQEVNAQAQAQAAEVEAQQYERQATISRQ